MYSELDGSAKPWWKNIKVLLTIAAFVLLIVVLIIIAAVVAVNDKKHSDNNNTSRPTLLDSMNTTYITSHLLALQDIAYENNGSRTALTGYNSSVDYVIDRINAETNYSVDIHYFDFLYYSENTPTQFLQVTPSPITFKYAYDFRPLRYIPSGDVTGTVKYAGGGCKASDYVNFNPGDIALIKRNGLSDCSVYDKVFTADSVGAVGLLIWTDASFGLFTKGLNTTSPILALSITYELGAEISQISEVENLSVRLVTDTFITLAHSMNVIAEIPVGDPKKTIIVGSHLDSVPAGPGINDNGSGSSINLELAIQLMKSNLEVKNRIRFAWWGAEEFGLLGSTAYVQHLVQTKDIENIALNLNFDMLASPNYFTGVYNGSGAAVDIRNTSEAITHIFEEFFNTEKLPFQLTEFNGRSDYGPFIENGVPAGGLASGAEGIKTMDQRDMFGGLANTAYDPCYHLSCDTVDNVNKDSLITMARAAAYAVQTLAVADLDNL